MLQKKICMLGSFAVGKTSLVRRYVESIYSEAYHTTVGVKIDKKVLRVDERELTLVLWDLYGADEFQALRMSYLRGMSGYLLVADGTRRATLDQALAIQQQVQGELGNVPFVALLNKNDLPESWEISSEAEAALQKRGCPVLRTSAKTGENVEPAFEALARAMLTTATE